MRISDWSSDVCSSDLKRVRGHSMPGLWRPFRSLAPCFPSSMPCRHRHRARGPVDVRLAAGALAMKSQHVKPVAACDIGRSDKGRNISNVTPQPLDDVSFKQEDRKSTRELQSLMRISYAVLCMKKKKKENNLLEMTPKARRTNTKK